VITSSTGVAEMRAALVAPLWRAVKMNDMRDETTPDALEFRCCALFY
jgi:hypothetical protein